MATAVSAAVSLPSSNSTSLSTRTSFISSDRITFKVPLLNRNVSTGFRVLSIRAQITTDAPAKKVEKDSKKMEEGVIVNKYRPKDPYVGKCLLNTRITADDAPGETWHMVFSTEGMGHVPTCLRNYACVTPLRTFLLGGIASWTWGQNQGVCEFYKLVFPQTHWSKIRYFLSYLKSLTLSRDLMSSITKEVGKFLFIYKIALCLVSMKFWIPGEIPYREGQSIGVIPDGVDKNGKPHKLRLYSIASSALGDFGDSKTVSLCVKRLVYTNDQGVIVKGVCSNFLCDLKPGVEVNITGPVGKEMLMPKDPAATVIMLATGTGIAPFRAFLWKMFFEKHDDYKFNGLAWLFLGVPTSSSLLYKDEFTKMKEKAPENFKVDYAISREETNEKGEKMYIQTRMAQYAEQLWELLKKDNTFVYMCGLKGMEKGIDDIMVSLAAKDGIDWLDYKKQLKKSEQWNVEVY